MSAIDMGRIWERALRRADLPIAYSEGFSPHPKIAFPDALPLGYASTGEYAELTFAGDLPVEPAMAALNAALPDGMDVLASRVVGDGDPRLSRWLRASVWDLRLGGITAQEVADRVAGVVDAASVVVERDRKGETTPTDVRPSIASLTATGTLVRAVVHHTEPPTRPSELLLALGSAAGALRAGPHDDGAQRRLTSPDLDLATRVAQGHPTDDGVIEALTGTLVPARPVRQKATAS